MVTSSSRIHGATRSGDLAFSVQLRRAMWAAHALASPSEVDHALLLTQLRFVYSELALAAEGLADDPIAAPFAAMDLAQRREAIDSDLRHLRGHGWDRELPLLAETHAYALRLRLVAGSAAGSFVAHHYTRYLGDLSDGIAINATASPDRGHSVPPGRRFRTCDAIADPDERKRHYRQLLDAAPWSALDKQLITSEALHAHRLNAAMLNAVERSARRRQCATSASA